MIRKEIGDKKREASSYGNLGDVFASVSECAKPEQPIVAPGRDLLEGPEIIVISHHNLQGRVPFASLEDVELSNKYLSNTFRIRIVPSMTTFKLI